MGLFTPWKYFWDFYSMWYSWSAHKTAHLILGNSCQTLHPNVYHKYIKSWPIAAIFKAAWPRQKRWYWRFWDGKNEENESWRWWGRRNWQIKEWVWFSMFLYFLPLYFWYKKWQTTHNCCFFLGFFLYPFFQV